MKVYRAGRCIGVTPSWWTNKRRFAGVLVEDDTRSRMTNPPIEGCQPVGHGSKYWNWEGGGIRGDIGPEGALSRDVQQVFWKDLNSIERENIQGTWLEKYLKRGLHMMTVEELWGNAYNE